ncbi:ATP synthase F1 subunit gamma [bacterium]|nr:ATP synthase F1 subunit gamma [bacterium]|tara:strand:- start:42632 stop:43549 length:918 start_codon:yes stop_codon:yes gene_type:complete
MAGLKQLKSKRESINKTRKVTRAMEAVSAVKMRKAQERALGGRAYAAGALRILSNLSGSVDTQNHFMMQPRTQGKYGIIVVTSDKGLAGSLNSAVLRKVDAFLGDPKYKDGDKVFMCIGRRGHEFIRSRDLEVLSYQENKSDSVGEEDMREITDMVVKMHEDGDTRAWYVAYTNFRSTFEQEAVLRRILPLSRGALDEVVEAIVPETGKYSDTEHNGRTATAYTIEPSPEVVLESIIPALVNIVVYHSLLESKASEHSARMVAMKNATDKAGELSHELMLKFNKARQAVITREVSEITSGIEAMK